MAGIKQWSPSRLFKYEQCPRAAKYAYIDKIPEPGPKSLALVNGEVVHGHLENYVANRVPVLDPCGKKVENLANELRKDYMLGLVRVEVELAITREWKPTRWLAPDTWGRFKLDVIRVVGNQGRVIDWKTGKYKPDGEYSDQLNAYSTAALSCTPTLDSMTSALVFVDHTEVPVERPEGTVVREKLAWQQEYWNDRVACMERDTVFATRPSFACKWCPYTKNKNGPCEY